MSGRQPIPSDVVGVVLAGGRGRRMGGQKAIVGFQGRPLVHYPLQALGAVLDEVVIVAKRDTVLPAEVAAAAAVWIEPDEPRHPLTGIVHALRRAGGRAVLVCAVDLVLIDPATLEAILAARAPGAAAVVPRAGGRLQPLCALYEARALGDLERLGPATRVTEAVMALDAEVLELADDGPLHNVNSPEDVLLAAERLRR